MWIDSHCHIQERYETDGFSASEAVDEASAAGVDGLVCIGTDPETSRQAIDLVGNLRKVRGDFGLWCTAGLHPHDASRGLEAVTEIESVVGEADVAVPGALVAVGECGLDYHYDHSPRDAQRRAFEAQIDLARKLRRTLVVHTRNAWNDTFEILQATGMPERVVIHCFTGGPPEAKRCLDLGAYLSFSGILTFKGAPEVRQAAALCPPERLLVETDAPFLAPVPYRGKPNRPAWVTVVGEAVAEVRGDKTEDLARTSTEAFRAAFAVG
jgi:TatD DNase family protein